MCQELERPPLPKHVAIIMDGNGRWARKKGLPRIYGHRAGAKAVRSTVRAAGELGIEVLTLYAFSTENWLRPQTETRALMGLLRMTLRREIAELNRNNVRLKAIGRLQKLPQNVQDELQRCVEATQSNSGLTLNLALNYGGRQDILDAVNALIKQGKTTIDEEDMSRNLTTAGLSDPDLLIRTSGEYRISNFLLWQIAYAELYVTPVLWPDFKRAHLQEALVDYQRRERRFGGL
jgi:undecaprenyl diphosphate synthase